MAKRRKAVLETNSAQATAVKVKPENKTLLYLICGLLILATLIVYAQSVQFDFITMDDYLYVTNNSHVKDGISPANIVWAFKSVTAANWHPLTMLSLMLDYDTGGLQAKAFHVTNLIFHILNVLLLFFVLYRMTGYMWRSAFVAALFAVHPLHVESVAWISERKDVLSTLFWLLTMLFYYRYKGTRSLKGYLWLGAMFILGLMSKPMLVTLPVILLLMDIWPLERFSLAVGKKKDALSVGQLIQEKAPLFGLVAVSCVATMYAQRAGGALATLDVFPVGIRVANALITPFKYLFKMIVPTGLTAFYPHPGFSIPSWQPILSAIALAIITYWAIRAAKSKPYITVGWFWYIITLLPVVGLIQVGAQAMADRYTYVPLIGIFIIIAWGIPDLLYKSSEADFKKAMPLGVVGVLVVIVLTAVAYKQTTYWKSDVTVWNHALEVTSNNALAEYNLACAYDERKQLKNAELHYRRAIEIDPKKAEAHNNLGNLLTKQHKYDEAEEHLLMALDARSGCYSEASNNLANVFVKKKRFDEAIARFKKAVADDPKNEVARTNYSGAENEQGIDLAKHGKVNEAIAHFDEAIRINPENSNAYYNLGVAYDGLNKMNDAEYNYRQALSLDSKYAEAHNNLGLVLAVQGKLDEAIEHFEEAVKIKPDFQKAVVSLDHWKMVRNQQKLQ